MPALLPGWDALTRIRRCCVWWVVHEAPFSIPSPTLTPGPSSRGRVPRQ
jgi:hypothetical protein